MANGLSRWRWVVCTFVALLASSGCVKTVNQRLASYQPGQAPTSQPVREAAVYQVKVYDRSGNGKLHGIDGTEQLLSPGDVVGFRTDEAGVVHAVANNVAIPLSLTADQKVVWFTQYQKQSHFGQDFQHAIKHRRLRRGCRRRFTLFRPWRVRVLGSRWTTLLLILTMSIIIINNGALLADGRGQKFVVRGDVRSTIVEMVIRSQRVGQKTRSKDLFSWRLSMDSSKIRGEKVEDDSHFGLRRRRRSTLRQGNGAL